MPKSTASAAADDQQPKVKVVTRPAHRIGEKARRGFAAMSPETQRRIASAGGKASHASGRGYRFTAEQAREAGRKGGQMSTRK